MSAKIIELKMAIPAGTRPAWNKGVKTGIIPWNKDKIIVPEGTHRVCTKCRKKKLITLFTGRTDKLGRKRTGSWCKPCHRKHYKSQSWYAPRRLIRSKWQRAYKLCRDRATSKGLDFDLTIKCLLDMWKTQQGKCALSGLTMTKGGKQTAYSVSVDRIYPQRGYVKSNIRLICFALNAFKGVMTDDEMLVMAKSVVIFSKLKQKKV